ncbi:MAG: epimerase [Paracoccaceae bacterium]|nr:epimerase [Paracoccaceae bacterium]
MTGKALILGGTGRFGRHMAEAFWNAGWRVALFDRAAGDLLRAAQGADVIVNGWNPAYPDWAAQLPGLTDQVIAAAQGSGATVLMPGNVYVYGAQSEPGFGPDTPHRATNPLGRLRIETEAQLRASGVPVILLRAGDFLDTEASGNWFDRIMAPSLTKGVLTYPGDPDVDHAWAYLPDLAQAGVLLAERRQSLPRYAEICFPGYTLSGAQLAALCAEALQRPVQVKRMNWLPLQFARPFWPMAKHLLEMRYLWTTPHHIPDQPFSALLPEFRPTPPAEALAQALAPVLQTAPRPNSYSPKADDAGRSALPAT